MRECGLGMKGHREGGLWDKQQERGGRRERNRNEHTRGMRKEEDQQHRDNDKGLKMGSRSTLIELAVIDAGEVGRRTLSRWFFLAGEVVVAGKSWRCCLVEALV